MNTPAPAPENKAPPKQRRPVRHYIERTDKRLRDGDRAGGREAAADGLKAWPADPSLSWRMAEIEFRDGDADAAKKRLRHVFRSRRDALDGAFFAAGARIGRDSRDAKFAEAMAREGLKRFPLQPELRLQAGRVHAAAGRHARALPLFETAVNLDPGSIPARRALAGALERAGDTERAARVLRQAAGPARGAVLFDILSDLANLLQRREEFDEARRCYERAMEIRRPAYLFSNFGALLRKTKDFDGSRAAYRRSLALDPGGRGAWYNLGNLEKETGRLDDATLAYRRALRIEPERAETHWNLALSLLAAGRLEEGFAEYEWRWRYDGFPSRRRNFPQPQWDGSPLAGRTLLVHAEQGLGDHIQFARFVPGLARQDGRVILECHEPLLKLFRQFEDRVEVVERLKQPDDFDVHLPLLSAPLALGARGFEDVPVAPWIEAPDIEVDLPGAGPGELAVGIVWAGNPGFSDDRQRSPGLRWFLPFLDKPGLRLYSLQKGDGEAQLRDAPPELVRLGADFHDTAAIMKRLDLVVSSDTSIPHLAGALGVPLWLALSHNPDWRWMRGRDDSPWYPTARLFRQRSPGDWAGVFGAIGRALDEALAARRAGAAPALVPRPAPAGAPGR